MKKSDLKTGMVVQMRNGCRGVVLRDAVCPKDNPDEEKDFIIGLKNPSDFEPFSDYNDDLLLKYRGVIGHRFDIVYVYEPDFITDVFKCAEGDLTEIAKCVYNRYVEE